MKFNVEYTDTFAGEANYSWVRRAEIEASGTLSRGAHQAVMRKAKAAVGLTGVRGRTFEYGGGIEFRPYRSCTVMFVTPED